MLIAEPGDLCDIDSDEAGAVYPGCSNSPAKCDPIPGTYNCTVI